MSSPLKPWEAGGANMRSGQEDPTLSVQSSTRIPDVNIKGAPAVPPQVPPRPANVVVRRPMINSSQGGPPQMFRNYPSANNYMGGYNAYGGYGGYGNCAMYGGMGAYGGTQYPSYLYNYSNTNDPNNRFVALAEETTRPAFESIESVVRAFGSVSFMLESTLGALHASFRAALGVADHLSHLRNILSALSLFRLLNWIIRRLRILFGAKLPESSLGSCWGDAVKSSDPVRANGSPPVPSQWPLGAFLGVVLSGSYLAWKLLAYVMGSAAAGEEGGQNKAFKSEETEPWVQGKDMNGYLAVATHDFLATSDQELPLRAGDRLFLAPKSRQPVEGGRDWVMAAHFWHPKHGGHPKIGIIPTNHIRILDRKQVRVQGGNPMAHTHSSQTVNHMSNVPPGQAYPNLQAYMGYLSHQAAANHPNQAPQPSSQSNPVNHQAAVNYPNQAPQPSSQSNPVNHQAAVNYPNQASEHQLNPMNQPPLNVQPEKDEALPVEASIDQSSIASKITSAEVVGNVTENVITPNSEREEESAPEHNSSAHTEGSPQNISQDDKE